MNKEILVTGGYGFLGSHLVEELLLQEPESNIHIVDNLSTSVIDTKRFLDYLGTPPNLTESITTVDDFLYNNEKKFDEIYHLASIVGPAGVLKHSGKIAKNVINDSMDIAERAMEWDAKLVDVSTSEVYGGGRDGYCAEDMDKIVQAETTIRLEYAVGKLAAETALINLTRTENLKAVIVRPFNIAGPRQNSEGGFVLPRFSELALSGLALTVFGNGSQIRAFTHVKDTARGLRLAMQKGRNGEVFNIGNQKNRTTIQNLAERVIYLACSSSEIAYVDPKEIYGQHYAEANDKFPSSKKARSELGWTPTRGLDAIIKDILAWTRSQRG